MSYGVEHELETDEDLQNFLAAEKESSRFKGAVYKLNDICWEKCMRKVEPDFGKVKGCMSNCVERFLDVGTFIVNRLYAEGGNLRKSST